ncbi:glucose-1-phosphate adenylyltransferase [Paenibacillus massiliensis]|uniref:glucose-1-phosphate adenylyltransferase n=1 Tax=Paenibacillus massiliensis TaxID=225917 RepID=UPI00046F9A6E|nr:glucose-1-phosphate adenylyltransferase [Paenibacillus massiliensis]
MKNKDCIAMLLAGGEGRRLAPFTSTIAKPAVPFGGHYRIIDFPLSNCANSEIDTVGVLTQYEAESLHQHIGQGEPWGLHNNGTSGVSLLPSYNVGQEGYTGTADAIYKNIAYIEQHNPEHVLILSGDHIYHMNYRDMLNFHIEKDAAASISVMEVPWNEASRFGILSANEHQEVVEFAEKPEQPNSNLASMGIYIFRWSYLKEYLLADANDQSSSHDFGKDIIPKMLAEQDPVYVYEFQGYWKDVGTVKSLWDSHMDLLQPNSEINLMREDWPMYTRITRVKPALRKNTVAANSCLIHESCYVEGTANNSIVFCGAEIGKSSRVTDSIIMPNARIGRNVVIEHAIIGEGAIVKDGAVIRGNLHDIAVVGPGEMVPGKPVLRQPSKSLLKEVYEKNGRLRAEGLSS